MSMYFNPETTGFMPLELKSDYEQAGVWPKDALEVSDEVYNSFRQTPPTGKVLGVLDGAPAWVDAPEATPLTVEEIETLRLTAYSDPLTGSDRFFSEATRLSLTGAPDTDVEAAKNAGVARYDEIKEQYPWP